MIFQIDTSIPPTKTLKEIRDEFKMPLKIDIHKLNEFREQTKKLLSEMFNLEISENDMLDISENKEIMHLVAGIISGKYSKILKEPK